jgi:hypothetical protein
VLLGKPFKIIHLARLLALVHRSQNPPTFGSWGFDSPPGTMIPKQFSTFRHSAYKKSLARVWKTVRVDLSVTRMKPPAIPTAATPLKVFGTCSRTIMYRLLAMLFADNHV